MLNSKLNRHLKLLLCTCLMSYIQFIIGCSFVFSSILLAKLKEPTSTIKINTEEGSWIASVPILVCPIGLVIVGILTDKIGRRKALQVAYIPLIISWLILAYANSYRVIIIGRIIMGTTMGSGTACAYLYLAEVCPTEYRPLFFSVVTIFVGVGMMSECIFAMFFHWQTVSVILFVMSVIGCASLSLVPETPMWLRNNGRVREAEAAAKWLGEEPVTAAAAAAAAAVADMNGPADANDTNIWRLLTRRIVWKPVLLTVTFFVCQQGSGFYVLLFYSMDVLRDSRVQWDGLTVTVFLSVGRVIGSLVFSTLHHVRRKTLTVVSGGGMALSLAVIVAYMRMYKDVADPPYPILQVTAFILYVFFALLAMLPLPWTLCGEVFPMAIKGTISGVVQVIGYELMFVVIKIYPALVNHFGIENVLIAFAAFSVASALFGMFLMPETKGKSLNEILSSFESRGKSTKNISP